MIECPNKEKNLQHCNCSYTSCDKKGVCCACIRYHRSMNQLPACFFSDATERTYDRSTRRFIHDNSQV